MRLLACLLVLGFALACNHDHAWIIEADRSGGVIGYTNENVFNSRGKTVNDFRKQADAMCGRNHWVVTKETIPLPATGAGVIGGLVSGDRTKQVISVLFVATEDGVHRSNVMAEEAPVSYHTPFKTWNEATLRCTEMAH